MFVLEQAGHNVCGRKSEIARMCARTVNGGQEYEPRERRRDFRVEMSEVFM